MTTITEVIRHVRKKPGTALNTRNSDPKELAEQNRIVLISPFPAFNMAFDAYLKQTGKRYELDEVTEAKIPLPPYIDVVQREKEKGMPAFIVDLRRIARASKDGPTIHQFLDYFKWGCETVAEHNSLRTRYLTPMAERPLYGLVQAYQLDMPFDPYSFKVNGLAELIRRDVQRIVNNGPEGGFELFGEARVKD
jgi:hypothetical protein